MDRDRDRDTAADSEDMEWEEDRDDSLEGEEEEEEEEGEEGDMFFDEEKEREREREAEKKEKEKRKEEEAEEEEEEEEEEDEEPPQRPGRKVKFEHRDKLAVEFEERDLWKQDPNEKAKDMIQAYHRECVNMRVKPIVKLLEQLERLDDLTTPIDTLDLKGVRLDNASCEVLETVLSRVHTTTLDLEKANLEDEGAIALCEMVEFYGCTNKINLAHNHRLRPRAWLTIGRTLKKSPFLTMANVSYCGLEEPTLTLLLRSVRANCCLQVLKLEGNNLTGKGTFILMAAMKFNENLQELYLGANHLGPEDGQHLGSILRTNHTLRILDVRENNLQDQGVRYICAGIAEQQEGLYILNLCSNNIFQDGIHHVSAMLPCTRSLRELNVSYNRWGDNGLFMLKLGLLANRSLEKLNLCNVKMTDEGAIALAEVLAENKHITHLDLRENDVRVAGLMGLQLAHRMNHTLLSMDTPKAFKVEQRDRQLIKDLLTQIEQYSSRNLKEKEERAELERRRQHEAQHAHLVASSQENLEETQQFTAGSSSRMQAAPQEEEEEEKEVDPSLVGTLDNVYTEAPGTMPGEDPFKSVPMMVDNEKPANLMEMEKTLDAMEAFIDQDARRDLDSSDDVSNSDTSGGSQRLPLPLDDTDVSSLDVKGGQRSRTQQQQQQSGNTSSSSPSVSIIARVPNPHVGGIELVEVIREEQLEHRSLNQRPATSDTDRGGGEGSGRMPDLLTSGPPRPPDIQLSSQPAPDLTTHTRTGSANRPPLGDSRRDGGAIDLLDNTAAASSALVSTASSSSSRRPLDLTDGLLQLQVGESGSRRAT